jgi:hypothetical protein
MSVYVDSAATGAADGTSWTDAFTTIQAAINSLPVVLEHAVTIYVRKGSTAYAENITIQQIVGKGSLTIRGEYYWYGECAAAATPSDTKFNLTATDGAQIAAGDSVLIRDGYADYVISTVKATVDKGSNVWEIELNNALPTGNIGTGDYYTIGKSQIVASSGIGLSVANTSALEISGLFIQSSSGSGIYISNGSGVTISGCFVLANTTNSAIQATGSGCRVSITKSYMYCSTTGRPLLISGAGGLVIVGNSLTGALSDGNALVTGGNSTNGLLINGPSLVSILGAVIDVLAGHAITAQNMSSVYLATTTISPTGRTAATVGITVSQSYAQKTGTLVNNATTPESGSVAAFAYIGT